MGLIHKGDGQIAVFDKDTDGSKPRSRYLMDRRNWCCITLQSSGELLFDIRVEKEKGHGETIGYAVLLPGAIQPLMAPRSYCIPAPPPRWEVETVE